MTSGCVQETIEIGQDISALVNRLIRLEKPGARLMVGISGAPGAGKSTLSQRLAATLGSDTAVVVPMDGFHLASALLTRPEQIQRRGAIDTFDVDGYLHLLRRLRNRKDAITYAPGFDRAIEEPIAGLIPVPRETPIVITEGNYLLSPEPGWREIRTLLDQRWFMEVPDTQRVQRLTARHAQYGKTAQAAKEMAEGSDENNARQIAASRSAADLVIRQD